MDDPGSAHTSSIVDYFQREKSVIKSDVLAEDVKNIAESSISKQDILQIGEIKECRPHVEIQKTNYVDGDNTCVPEKMKTDVQHLCHKGSHNIFSGVKDVNRKCGLEKIDRSDKKAKWNFTWKGKTKKAKVDSVVPDSDLTGTSLELYSHQTAVASTKSITSKKSIVGGSKLNPSGTSFDTKISSNVSDNTDAEYDAKALGISEGKHKETLNFPSLPPECRDRGLGFGNHSKSIHVIASSCNENSCKNLGTQSDNLALHNKITADDSCKSTSASKIQPAFSGVIESSYNVNDLENVEGDSRAISSEICDDLESRKSDESKSMMKDGLETPKKSYFDILMQKSKANADKMQIFVKVQENYGSKRCEKANANKIEDSSRNNEKTRNVNKTSRKSSHDVGLTNSHQSSMKKQNRGDSNIHQTETREKRVRKSTRRKIKANESENEKANTECSTGEDMDECESSTCKSRVAASESDKATFIKKESLEESADIVCSDEQLEKAKEIELCKGKEVNIVALSCGQENNQIKSRECNQSENRAKGSEEDRENAVSTKQKNRSKRLRKSCILDSDEDEVLPSETKPSTSETSRQENQPKKGSIASIFLPGAWRRAKAKLEEAERLEIKEDSSSPHISQTINLPTLNEDNICCSVKSGENSTVNRDSALSISAFSPRFQKPLVKTSTVIIQFTEAPFPKVSHVRQQDEKYTKWNLPMVRNRFVKEEYFFMVEFDSSITGQNFSSWFTGVSRSEEKTRIDSKSIPQEGLLEMDKTLKQAVVSHLKTIYKGVPLKRLFKRCEHHLKMCQKSLLETENTSSLVIEKEKLKQPLATFLKGPSIYTTSGTSAQVPAKNVPFTKVSRKKLIPKANAKLEKEMESPLLMAFRKQEKTSNKNEAVKIKEKQSRVKNISVMEFMGVETKQTKKIPENSRSAKSKKRKTASRKIMNTAKTQQTKTSDNVNRKTRQSKKRVRESESAGPTVKQVKLLYDTQEFKKPRKGQKRKVQSPEYVESVNAVDAKDAQIEVSEKSTKCRKISSDDDFVKLSSRRFQSKSEVDIDDKAFNKDGTETKCARKSRRLQEKSTAKKADKPVISLNACGLTKVNQKEDDRVNQNDQNKSIETDIIVIDSNTSVCEPDKEKLVSNKNVADQSSWIEKEIHATSGISLSSVLWSECFKPRNSSEILGNNNSGAKLKNWLSEWKTLRERKLEALKRKEEKQRQRLAAKKNDKETSSRWYDDDDSDDFYSSDDSGSEICFDEENVCNTMLLTGLSGCGKTAAVYACAEELGFKVIEVNSATKRGGKYILTELLEATQSHQVSNNRNLDQGQSLLVPSANNGTNNLGGKKGKGKSVEKNDNVRTKKGRPKKNKELIEEISKEIQIQGSMSLILLDEVDVLFEEDKGFWVSVNTLRQNSKRPIVMTASDSSTIDVDGEFEHISLKAPSLNLYSAYLQTVCLVKNVFVNPHDIQVLSWLHYSDIRGLLLSLQFWVDSNADAGDEHGVTIKDDLGTNAIFSGDNEPASILTDHNSPDDTEDVTSVEQSKDDQGYVTLNSNNYELDQTSTSCNPVQQLDENELVGQEASSGTQLPNENKMDSAKACEFDISPKKNEIEMHNFCLESLLGLRNINNNGVHVLEILKAENSFQQKCLVTSHCQSLKIDVVYNNLEILFPYIFCSVNKIVDNPMKRKKKESDGNKYKSSELENGRDIEEEASLNKGNIVTEETTIDDEDLVSKDLVGVSLKCLGDFHENMSFMESEFWYDSPETSKCKMEPWCAKISPGLNDSVAKYSRFQITWNTRNAINELRGALEICTLEHSHKLFHDRGHRSIEEVMTSAANSFSGSCSLSHFELDTASNDMQTKHVKYTASKLLTNSGKTKSRLSPLDVEPCLQVTTSTENSVRRTIKQELDYTIFSSHLPEFGYLNRRNSIMEYLPTLHSICRDESIRKAERVKRRFYHYLDSVGLHIPSSLIKSLTEGSYFKQKYI